MQNQDEIALLDKLNNFKSHWTRIQFVIRKESSQTHFYHSLNRDRKLLSIAPQNSLKKKGLIIFRLTMKQANTYVTIGNAFLISQNVALCSSHQLKKSKQYYLQYYGSEIIRIKVCRVFTPEPNYVKQFNTKDYSFLLIQEQHQIQLCRDKTEVYFTDFSCIKHCQFECQIIVLGYWESGQSISQEWKRTKIVQSKGFATYHNNILNYTNSTEKGLSGSPIIKVFNQKIYLIGMHSSGSNYHSKNFGIVFGKAFFEEFDKFMQMYKCKVFPIFSKVLTSISFKERLGDYLSQAHSYSKISDYQNFVACLLNKLLAKFYQFESASLLIKNISLSNILIFRISGGDFQIQFQGIEVANYEQAENHELFKNIHSYNSIVNEILKQRSFNDKASPHRLLKIIKFTVDTILKQYESSSKNPMFIVAYILSSIKFLEEQHATVKDYCKSIYIQVDLEEQYKEQRKFFEMISFHKEIICLNSLRRKFILLAKHSSMKLSKFQIMKTYLLLISLLRNKMIKIIQSYIQLDNVSKQKLNKYKRGYLQAELLSLQQLTIFRTKGLSADKENSYESIMKIQNEIQKEIQIRKVYLNLFEEQALKLDQELVKVLVTLQMFFIQNYYRPFQQRIEELEKVYRAKGKDQFTFYWQLNKQKCEALYKRTLQWDKRPIIKNKPNKTRKKFNINSMRILRAIFIHNELLSSQNNHLLPISSLSIQEQTIYKDITKIVILITDQQKKQLGTGFFISKNIVCTARHIFRYYQNIIQQCLIVDKHHQTIGRILNASFPSSKSSIIFGDIVMLDVDIVSDYKGQQKCQSNHEEHQFYNGNIKLINYDEDNGQENHFYGIMFGYRKDGELVQAFGQMEIQKGDFQPIIGQENLSGSPILLKILKENGNQEKHEYQYVVVGVYKGLSQNQSMVNSTSGLMSKFKKSFFSEEIFLQKIDFANFSDLKVKLTSTFKQWIKHQYTSFDHFLLKVLGQILRLNSEEIYIPQLSLKNLIIQNNQTADLLFSDLSVKAFFEEKQPQNNQDKLQTQNKNAFCSLVEEMMSDKSHINFQKDDKFLKQSVLLMKLKDIKESSSLTEFYYDKLERYYTFNKDNFSLELSQLNYSMNVPQPYIFTNISYETILEKLYRRFPNQFLTQLIAGFNILKNAKYKIQNALEGQQGKRMYCLSVLKNKDDQRLKELSKIKIQMNHFYYLALKLIKEQSDSLCSKLLESKSKGPDKEEEEEELERERRQFQKYLMELTQFADLDIQQKKVFISKQLFKFKYDFIIASKWQKLLQIVDLYEAFK